MRRLLIVGLALVLGLAESTAGVKKASIQDVQRVKLDSLLAADALQSSSTRYTLQSSPYMNDTVEVTGICVVPKGIFGYNNAGWSMLLYDTTNVSQWRGLWLRVNALADTAQAILDGFNAVEPGDVITVRGVVSEFPTNYLNSMTQLNYLPGQLIVPITKVKVPPPLRLSVSTFYEGVYPGGKIKFSTGEPYESMIVEFTDLVVPSVLNGTNGTFNMVQSGNMVSSYDASDYYTLRRANPPGWTYQMPPVNAKIDTVRGAIWVVSGAENLRGYRIAPVYPGHLVVGPVLPLLLGAKRNPIRVQSSDSVKFTVRALRQTNGYFIDSVKFYSSVNGAAFTGSKMTLVNPSDSTFQAVIPPQADNAFVRYFVKAYDRQGNVTTLASYGSSAGSDTAKGMFFYYVTNRALSIRDIQYTPFLNGYSPYATDSVNTGGVVDVGGIVTADTSDILLNSRSTVGGAYGWYMQSGNAPWSGVWLYGDSTMKALRRGDSIRVQGAVQEWTSFSQNVTTRITNIHAPTIVSRGNPVPAPVVLTTGTFRDTVASGDRNAEPYEGMLVRFNTVTVTDTFPYFSDPTLYEINDASGAVWIHRDGTNTYTNKPTEAAANPALKLLTPGTKISNITGLIHYSANRYKFVPRSNADFGSVTGAESHDQPIPDRYDLAQNYPNPFNPSTVVEYSLPAAVHVTLKVYDLLGREVATLVDGLQLPGAHSVRFDARSLATGPYFYRLSAGGFVQVKKMVLVR
jgi:hypothetical protein